MSVVRYVGYGAVFTGSVVLGLYLSFPWDAVKDRLLYKTVQGGTASAEPEVIDDCLRPDGPHSVGAGASLHADASAVRVVYQDQRVADLLDATKAGFAWTRVDLRKIGRAPV